MELVKGVVEVTAAKENAALRGERGKLFVVVETDVAVGNRGVTNPKPERVGVAGVALFLEILLCDTLASYCCHCK